MKLGKIFICINILVLSLSIGEKYTPSQFKNRNSKTKMVFEILMAWENEFVKIFTLFPEIHAPVLSHFITLKHYSQTATPTLVS